MLAPLKSVSTGTPNRAPEPVGIGQVVDPEREGRVAQLDRSESVL